MKKFIFATCILYTSLSLASGKLLYPIEIDFYVPDYPSKLTMYIQNPMVQCKSKDSTIVACTVPRPSDGIISTTSVDSEVEFYHIGDLTKYCSYEVYAVYNPSINTNDYFFTENPPARLIYGNISCAVNYYTTSPTYTYKVAY